MITWQALSNRDIGHVWKTTHQKKFICVYLPHILHPVFVVLLEQWMAWEVQEQGSAVCAGLRYSDGWGALNVSGPGAGGP